VPPVTLTEARVRALTPRTSARDIRDAKQKGFGVRVLPSGAKRYFVHCQHNGNRVWRIVGDADTMETHEARSRATAMLAAIRGHGPVSEPSGETLFASVAGVVFERHARIWKPGTLEVNRGYLRNQILPHFANRQIAEITRQDVVKWFASLAATPVAADRSMPVLSVIMREAERLGYREEGSNPCLGIRRYRRRNRERFLSDAEIRSLATCLEALEGTRPLAVAAIRLLLLTGCRKTEILTLRWSDLRDGALFLRDSKTGPRTVWLSRPAREVLERTRRTSPWVFPAVRGGRPHGATWLYGFWSGVRIEAGLGDARLHDLRHTYATVALRGGENTLVIARLLGHGSAKTTLGYTHLADTMVREAAAAVGAMLEG